MDADALRSLLDRVAGVRVACVGDLMLDRYVYGEVSRISPEAPIPVLARAREHSMLGAVGNVARNVAALGALADLVGVVGDDAAAEEIALQAEAAAGVSPRLANSRGRTTTVKTRFVAGAQQLLRLDHEDDGPLGADGEAALAAAVAEAGAVAGAFLVSDYAKGVVTPAVMAAVRDSASGRPVVVDPKGVSFAKYGSVSVVKPNAAELALVTGLPVGTDAEVEVALLAALDGCEAGTILVTRAGKGMSWLTRGGEVRHAHGLAREVFDVSGAGDTVLAALGCALAAGASLEDAVGLALLASGVVVGKAGTATATVAELLDAAAGQRPGGGVGKLVDRTQAAETVAGWRARGLRVGFTNGCFDVLHAGHVAYLAQAREWSDRLVVGLNDDASVTRLKGAGRPVNRFEDRAAVLAGLAAVDMVVGFAEDTPQALIAAVRPEVLVKGADYEGREVVGGDLVRGWGGEVRLAPLAEGRSSTATIARMRES